MIVEPHSYSVTNLCNVRMLNFPQVKTVNFHSTGLLNL